MKVMDQIHNGSNPAILAYENEEIYYSEEAQDLTCSDSDELETANNDSSSLNGEDVEEITRTQYKILSVPNVMLKSMNF